MLLTNITYNESADQYTLFFSRPDGKGHHIMVRNVHGLSDLFHGELNYKADVQAYADLEAAHKYNLDLLVRLSSDDDINDDAEGHTYGDTKCTECGTQYYGRFHPTCPHCGKEDRTVYDKYNDEDDEPTEDLASIADRELLNSQGE